MVAAHTEIGLEGHIMKDAETEGLDRQVRRIERELDYGATSIELEMASKVRLLSIAALAVMLGATLLMGADTMTASDAVRVLAIVAGASAAWHVATWALLRVWLGRAHGR